MGVLKDGITKPALSWNAAPFAFRPAVICPAHALIDLLPFPLANVIDEETPGSWLDGEREGIAQAEGPDGTIHTRGHGKERIVRWDGSIAVQAQYFPETIRQRLSIG